MQFPRRVMTRGAVFLVGEDLVDRPLSTVHQICQAYRSCSVAILFAAIMVYQGLPSGATVTPNGSLPFTVLPWVITPVLPMLAMLSVVS